MMNRLTRALAAGFAAISFALPLAASAVSVPATRTLVLSTKMVHRLRAGEYDGRLRLSVTPNGIISGSYQDGSGGLPSSVVGGVTAGKLWIDIAGTHFVGTMNGATIDAWSSGVAAGAPAYQRVDDVELTTAAVDPASSI
jgi:hypothetical protein